jgi:pSer/pThr/pTyr-binding forkhead associated (FHA) protein
MEYPLEGKRTTLGRSAQVEILIDDPSISSEHVAFELGSDGFGIRDLASTNGVRVNGSDILATPLKHGDLISLGGCELQYIIEDRARNTKTWVLDSEDATEEEP